VPRQPIICCSTPPKPIDDIPLAKVPTTKAMARRTQEYLTYYKHDRPKLKFTWAKEDVKT